jgi:hypothetical protein
MITPITMTRDKNLESLPIDPSILARADWWFDISWYGLLIAGGMTALAAVATVIFLFLQFWSSGVRERHTEWRTTALETETATAKEETARLSLQAEQLRSENLALEKVSAPRRIPIMGGNDSEQNINRGKLSEVVKSFAGITVFIQAVPDFESQILANDIGNVLEHWGWNVKRLDSSQSGFSPGLIFEGVSIQSQQKFPLDITTGGKIEQTEVSKKATAAALAAVELFRIDLGELHSYFGVRYEPDVRGEGINSPTLGRTIGAPEDAIEIVVGLKPIRAALGEAKLKAKAKKPEAAK